MSGTCHIKVIQDMYEGTKALYLIWSFNEVREISENKND